ncbi:DoxX family protein [Sphingomonas sp. Mn802worker]|uniref:DoxX family protein n=1 Tax=Sphingomonas sp. Mn802worker TaxID=629773 RepID=UPI000369A62D|nr:DoxX family protein [Sphingomonas sp. Mn802worker]
MTETRVRSVGCRLLTAFYALAGAGHLYFTEAIVRIVPAWVPQPRVVVLATGICELAGAMALVFPRWRRPAGWALAAYALCVWPANVQHAINDLSHGTGLSIWYHAPRLALQPLIIWWALWASGAVRVKQAP